jgi:hypothetical protein
MYYQKITAKKLLFRELYIRFASGVTVGDYRSRFIVGEYFYEKYISKYTAWKKLPMNNYLALFICTIYCTHKHYLEALESKQSAHTCT